MPLLELRDVAVALERQPVLTEISFCAERGQLLALIGPNGAGKTTLLRAIARLIPHHGAILFNGSALEALPESQRARQIAYLAQSQEAHWPMSVADIVALGRLPHRTGASGRLTSANCEAVENALAAAELKALRARPITALSAGERARAMVARALAVEADLLLADEPVAALDPYHQLHIMELLRGQVQAGRSVIAVLHDLRLAAQFADFIVMLNGGRIAAMGAPAHLLTPARLEAVYRIRQIADEPAPEGANLSPLLGPRWRRV